MAHAARRGTPATFVRRTSSGGRRSSCGQRLGQAVGDLHVPAAAASAAASCRGCPGTQSAVPAATMSMTDAQRRPGMSRPRSTRSPRKTAFRPGGMRVARRPWPSPRRRDRVAEPAEQRVQLVAAAVDVADDVERAVLVRAVVPERLRARSSTASTSSGASRTKTWRKPSRFRRRSERRSLRLLAADDVRAEGAVGPRRGSARGRASRAGSSTMATGRQWYSRARATSGLRASGCTLVASTTVSRPRPAACAAMKCSTSKASLVAAWSFSSSRHEPAAGVGREDLGRLEVLAGERGLARARGADQDDEGQLGDGDLHAGDPAP